MARQISIEDFWFDYIFGMDELGNSSKALKSSSKILLLGSFNPNQAEKVIRDPIGRPKVDFEKCYEQISLSCEKFLEKIIEEKNLI